MFLYVLVDCNIEADGYFPFENVIMASTNLEKILDKLSLDNLSYSKITQHSILVCVDGKEIVSCFDASIKTFTNLSNYPRRELIRYEEDYSTMINQIEKWSEKLNNDYSQFMALEKLNKEKEKEKQERELYEKLKAKYES